MSITVLFFASLAEAAGITSAELDGGPQLRPGAICDRFASGRPSLQARRSSVLCSVNQQFARLDTPVHDGDEVAFFPPVSGG